MNRGGYSNHFEQNRHIDKQTQRPVNHDNQRDRIQCFRCNGFNHISRHCTAFNNPQSARQIEEEETEIAAAVEFREEIAMLNVESNKHDEWCLDSGCTSHMCSDMEMFMNFTKIDRPSSLANNESTRIDGTGLVQLEMNDGCQNRLLKLNNVLHVSDLITNLLSVAKMTDHNFTVIFKKDHAEVAGLNGETVLISDRICDLYYARKLEEVNIATTRTESKSMLAPKIWSRK